MSRISPIHFQKLVNVLLLDGFRLVRQRGDHLILTKPGVPRPAVVPRYNPLPVFIIKNILRTARIGREGISSCSSAPDCP